MFTGINAQLPMALICANKEHPCVYGVFIVFAQCLCCVYEVYLSVFMVCLFVLHSVYPVFIRLSLYPY